MHEHHRETVEAVTVVMLWVLGILIGIYFLAVIIMKLKQLFK